MGGSLTLILIKQLDYIGTWQKSLLTLEVNVGRTCLDFADGGTALLDVRRGSQLCAGEGALLCALEAAAKGSLTCLHSSVFGSPTSHASPCTTALAGVE